MSPRKAGGTPRVSTIFNSLSVENKQDATRRPNLSYETNFSDVNGDRETFIFPVQFTTSRIGNFTRLIYTLSHDHTYSSISCVAVCSFLKFDTSTPTYCLYVFEK